MASWYDKFDWSSKDTDYSRWDRHKEIEATEKRKREEEELRRKLEEEERQKQKKNNNIVGRTINNLGGFLNTVKSGAVDQATHIKKGEFKEVGKDVTNLSKSYLKGAYASSLDKDTGWIPKLVGMDAKADEAENLINNPQIKKNMDDVFDMYLQAKKFGDVAETARLKATYDRMANTVYGTVNKNAEEVGAVDVVKLAAGAGLQTVSDVGNAALDAAMLASGTAGAKQFINPKGIGVGNFIEKMSAPTLGGAFRQTLAQTPLQTFGSGLAQNREVSDIAKDLPSMSILNLGMQTVPIAAKKIIDVPGNMIGGRQAVESAQNAANIANIKQVQDLAQTPSVERMRTELKNINDFMVAKGKPSRDLGKLSDEEVFTIYQKTRENPSISQKDMDEFRNNKSIAEKAIEEKRLQNESELSLYKEQLSIAETDLKQVRQSMTAGKKDMTLKELAILSKQYEKDIKSLKSQIKKLGGDTAVATEFVPGAKPAMVEEPALPSREINADIAEPKVATNIVADLIKKKSIDRSGTIGERIGRVTPYSVVRPQTPEFDYKTSPKAISQFIKEVKPKENIEIINKPKVDIVEEKAKIDNKIQTALDEGDNITAASLIKQKESLDTTPEEMVQYYSKAKSKEDISIDGEKELQFRDAIYKIIEKDGKDAGYRILNDLDNIYKSKPGDDFGNPVARIKESVGIPQDVDGPAFNKIMNGLSPDRRTQLNVNELGPNEIFVVDPAEARIVDGSKGDYYYGVGHDGLEKAVTDIDEAVRGTINRDGSINLHYDPDDIMGYAPDVKAQKIYNTAQTMIEQGADPATPIQIGTLNDIDGSVMGDFLPPSTLGELASKADYSVMKKVVDNPYDDYEWNYEKNNPKLTGDLQKDRAIVSAIDSRAYNAFNDVLKKFFPEDKYDIMVGNKLWNFMERKGWLDAQGASSSAAFVYKNKVGIVDKTADLFELESSALHETLHLFRTLMSSKEDRLKLMELTHNQFKDTDEYITYTQRRMQEDPGLSQAAAAEEFTAQKFTEFALRKEGYRNFEMNWKTGNVDKLPGFSKKTPVVKDLPFVGEGLKKADLIWERIKTFITNKESIELEFKKIIAGEGKKADGAIKSSTGRYHFDENGNIAQGFKNKEFEKELFGSMEWNGDELIPRQQYIGNMDKSQALRTLDKYLALQHNASQTTVKTTQIDRFTEQLISDIKAKGWITDAEIEPRLATIIESGRNDAFLKPFLEAQVMGNGSYRILNREMDVPRVKQLISEMRSGNLSEVEQKSTVQELLARGMTENDLMNLMQSTPGSYMKDGVMFNKKAPTDDYGWWDDMFEPKQTTTKTAEELATGEMYNFDNSTKAGKLIRKITGLDSEMAVNMREWWEDSHIRLKQLQRMTGNVSDEMNPYQRIENMGSRIEARKAVNMVKAQGIIDDTKVLAKNLGLEDKVVIDKIDDYLIAKTGLERIEKHGKDVVFGRENPDQTIGELTQVIAKTEADPNFPKIQKVAQDIQNISKETLEILYDGGSEFGVLTKAQYDELMKYDNHINLMRDFSEDAEGNPLRGYFTNEDYSSATGGNMSVRNPGIRNVKGGDFAVDDILTNQINMLNMAVAKVEKNKSAQALVNFANYFNTENAAESAIKGRQLFEVTLGKPAMNEPNVITAMFGGEPVSVRINDQKLANAISGLNVDEIKGATKIAQVVNGWRGALATKYNLPFAIGNKMRDVGEVMEIMRTMPEFKGNISKSFRETMVNDMRTVQQSHHGVQNAQTKLYQQMIEDGGAIGGLGMNSKTAINKSIEAMRRTQGKPEQAGKAVLKFFEDWNDVAENSSRFTIYKAALDGGLSRERAAWLAKEVGTNFQRHGTGGFLRSSYLFFNPSIQGNARTMRAWINNPAEFGKFMFALGGTTMAANAWNDSIDENWRDDTRLSQHTRNTNMVFLSPWERNGKRDIIKIPLGYSIAPWKSMMDYGQDYATGKIKLDEATLDVMKAFGSGYNPVGGGENLGSSVMPTQLGPVPTRFLWETGTNENFMGTPIKPKGKENLPASWQYYDSSMEEPTGSAAIKLSRFLADATGAKKSEDSKGVIEISPEHITYALDQILSGVGKTVTKTYGVASKFAKGEDVNPSDFPVVERFIGELRPSRKAETEMYDILGRRDDQSVKEAIAKQRIKNEYTNRESIPQSEIDNLKNIGMTSRQIKDFLKEFNLDRKVKSFKSLNKDDEEKIFGELSPQLQAQIEEETGINY